MKQWRRFKTMPADSNARFIQEVGVATLVACGSGYKRSQVATGRRDRTADVRTERGDGQSEVAVLATGASKFIACGGM